MFTKLAKILSVDTKNIDGGWGSAPDPAGVTHDTPPYPRIGPKRLAHPGFQ